MTTLEDPTAIIAQMNQEWATLTGENSLDERSRLMAEMAVFGCQERLRLRGLPFFQDAQGRWRLGGSTYGKQQ